jgi:hypothetical protein
MPSKTTHHHVCEWCHGDLGECDWPPEEGCSPEADPRNRRMGHCCQECYDHDPGRYRLNEGTSASGLT